VTASVRCQSRGKGGVFGVHSQALIPERQSLAFNSQCAADGRGESCRWLPRSFCGCHGNSSAAAAPGAAPSVRPPPDGAAAASGPRPCQEFGGAGPAGGHAWRLCTRQQQRFHSLTWARARAPCWDFSVRERRMDGRHSARTCSCRLILGAMIVTAFVTRVQIDDDSASFQCCTLIC